MAVKESIKTIIYKIKERDTNYQITDDYRIHDNVLISLVNDVRASLIRDEYRKKKRISEDYYQRVCCNLIKCEDISCDYKGETISLGETAYYVELPQLIENAGTKIKYVGDKLLSNKMYDYYNLAGFSSIEGKLYVPKVHAFTIINNKLYLKNLHTLGEKFLCYSALLLNPLEACDWDNEKPYPVPSTTTLIDMVVKMLKEDKSQFIDSSNDAKDDTALEKDDLKQSR